MHGRKRWVLVLATFTVISTILYFTLFVNRPAILKRESEHFSFYFDGFSEARIQPIIDSLEKNYDRIITDLEVDSMPVVRVKIWTSRMGFYREMERLLGVRYSGADGYVFGPSEFHVMLVNDDAIKAVHEFAHVVSLNLNPTFANNPRWLWEAVAIYEAGQFVHPTKLGYMVDGNYPSLEELDSSFGTRGNRIYSVGYLLADYIIDSWGMEFLRALIRTNGDLKSVLGVGVEEFAIGWYNWVEAKYFS